MDASSILLCLLCISVGSFTVYKKFLTSEKSTSIRNARRPPGPPGIPLLGNIFDVSGNQLHRTLAKLAAVHGPVMSLKLGMTKAIVVSTAAGARDVLQTHDSILAGRSVNDAARALRNHEISLVWLPSGAPLFRLLRVVCNTHLFSARGLEASRAVREQKVRELVESLRTHHAGRAVDIGGIMLSVMLNIMSGVLFSEDVADLSSDHEPELETLIRNTVEEFTKPNLSDIFPALARLDLNGRRRNNAVHMQKLYDFFGRVINRRRQRGTAGGDKDLDVLDELLQLHSEGRFSLDTVKSLLLDLFVAGASSTAQTVQWTLAEIFRHPAVMSKARQELESVVGSKEHPQESDIDKLPYLRAVVMEGMRLHPAGPLMMPHTAAADGAEVGGFPVPKGTKVIVNLWAIMRDPASWEKPEEFMPERFLGTGIDFRGVDARAFVPFGEGRRLCPGIHVATLSIMMILASVLHAFEWSLPDGMKPSDVDVTDRFRTSLHMVTPVKAVPTPVRR
ncbi:unnamed protein product [Urochloa decumbens]|uniref:Cytochrome P450 n=1 Tax=Urochloa decumbens TaxID=240449 RepID=A0ABC9F1G1_9POAL